MTPTAMLWLTLTILWTAGGILAAKAWRSYSKHRARGGNLTAAAGCPTHGRRCVGHVHMETLGDVTFFHWPDGTITAGHSIKGITP